MERAGIQQACSFAEKDCRERVVTEFDGTFPSDLAILVVFPGIGTYTASAIVTFVFNKPMAFLETNIRTVFIHFFFSDSDTIKDSEILPFVEKTLDRLQPRRWFYALIDYGAVLKRRHRDLNKKSAHYHKQAPFKGSDREIRGLVLEVLLVNSLSESEIIRKLKKNSKRVKKTLLDLPREGFLKKKNGKITIA